MKLLTCSIFGIMLLPAIAFNQQITGTITQQPLQSVTLYGYDTFQTIELGKTTLDTKGHFNVSCTSPYSGMGYIETADKSRLFLVINEPKIEISGVHLQLPDSTHFNQSNENNWFATYAKQHGMRESALAGWKYLAPQYSSTYSLGNPATHAFINTEIKRLENEDQRYIDQLPASSYVKWYIPIRKLIDDMPMSAQRYVERIPKNIADFRSMDFTDKRLVNSGILDDLLEGHYLLLENMGQPLDTVYKEMNRSTDYLLDNLMGHDILLNDVADYLFNLMEKRSLYTASEYLALQMLNQNSCSVDHKLAKQLETYRAMKVGNTAPDIQFIEGIKNENLTANNLSEMDQEYTLVVFGASWCPHCTTDIPKINQYYESWKAKGMEVVLITLDHNEEQFTSFTQDFPWPCYSDFKAWESPIAESYYVFATPTMYLLDKDRNIMLRPISAAQVDAWMQYKL
ncbi:thioredoxin family protein [Flavobacteriales bacterium]|nr:thioredoxin family protein [Flavobacteriales bacterium]